MILDLHTHSVRSDDGRAKVDNYCQWIRRKELPLDGLVLTELGKHLYDLVMLSFYPQRARDWLAAREGRASFLRN